MSVVTPDLATLSGSDLDEPILNSNEPSIKFHGGSKRTRYLIALCIVCCMIAIGCCVALGVVLALNSSSDSSSQANLPSKWLRMFALSDVHLDVLYLENASAFSKTPCNDLSVWPAFGEEAVMGRVGCDSPQKLLESTLRSMREVDSSDAADIFLVTGDKSGHHLFNFPDGNSRDGTLVLEAQSQFTRTLNYYFPGRQFILTMGNNDVPYHWQVPTSSWYMSLWPHWAPLILCKDCPRGRYAVSISETEFNSTFIRGGYYKIDVSEGLTMLVINSLYWCPYAWSSTVPFRSDIPEIANEQMDWLSSELAKAAAASRKVSIVGHVPPGLDPYRPVATNVSYVRQFWFDNYTQIYLQTVGETYRDTVVCTFFAHLHKDDFHVLSYDASNDAARVATILFSSISPVYENNPAYRLMYFNPDGWFLADYTQYWTDLVLDNIRKTTTLWDKQYTFSEAYPGPQRIDATRLQALWSNITNTTSSAVWHTYISHRQIYAANTLNSYSRDHLFCVAHSANVSSYESCRLLHPYEPKS